MGGIIPGGGGGLAEAQTPTVKTTPAVQVTSAAKGRSAASLMRMRQARAGQSSMVAGGYSTGGGQGGKTLMGA